MCCVELGLLTKGCFAPVLVVKGRLHKALGPVSARQLCYMCMPMRPNYKAETAVHGCHHLGQEPIGLLPGWYGCAYARPWVRVWACHLLLLFEKSYLSCRLCQMFVNSHNKNRMTHPLQVAKNCTTHPLPRVQKLMTYPLSTPAHPHPLYFLTSPLLKKKKFCTRQVQTEFNVCYLVLRSSARNLPASKF